MLPGLSREDVWAAEQAVLFFAGPPDTGDLTRPPRSLHELAVVARNILEAQEVPDIETVSVGSDWVLSIVASMLHGQAYELEKQEAHDAATKLRAMIDALYERIAASRDRSPLLAYQDIYERVAESLACRDEKEAALVRQREGVVHAMHDKDHEGVLFLLSRLARLHRDFADMPKCLAIHTGTLGAAPENPYLHAWAAADLSRGGLPTLAALVAERGLAVIRKHHDPANLEPDFRGFMRARSPLDTIDVSRGQVDALREALRSTGERPSEMALRVVPELATTRVKQLPSMPEDAELAEIAIRLRPLAERIIEARAREDSARSG
jgi:hypothetical protein